jgi:uncharacterized protein (DUF2236 family)
MATGEDEGYFGPDSATWAVHGSLPTLVGGIRALLMQALHPGALAGVMQHSRYQEDALGRLAGTTQWLTVVTFGDRAAADRECARVRGLHRRVVGTYPTDAGQQAYSASDPDLLRWVHIAFTDSFLATHRVWGGPIPGGEDEYVREWATAGELVGVENPPRSVAELTRQIADYAPVLRGDDAARQAILGRAREIFGAERVVDQLGVSPVAAPPNWAQQVQKATQVLRAQLDLLAVRVLLELKDQPD